MYRISTSFTVETAHNLKLDYESPCERLHGHSNIVTVFLESKELDSNGMVIDFKKVKKLLKEHIEDKLDHQYLNNLFTFNPTAENLSKWVYDVLNKALQENELKVRCYKVEFNETAKNKAIYEA